MTWEQELGKQQNRTDSSTSHVITVICYDMMRGPELPPEKLSQNPNS